MRSFLVLSLTLSCTLRTAAAQEITPTPSRWTISAGPEWRSSELLGHFWGMRLRAEYDLTRPSRVFGLRLEGGARWGPTQSRFYESGSFSQGAVDQTTDLMLGVSGSFSPFPKARVSPYVTLGVHGRQMWNRGSYFIHDTSFISYDRPYSSQTRGDIIAALGIGLRFRLGGHSFQLELRNVHGDHGLTFGSRLPF